MKEEAPAKPDLNVEVSAIGADDFGAAYADELRLSGDSVLQARGGGDLGLYERLLSDAQVASTWQQRRRAVVSRDWDVEPGAEDAKSVEAAEYLKSNLVDIGWDRVSYKMLMGVYYGFNPAECMYVADGTRIRLSNILVRKPRRFRFDKDGQLRLVTKKDRVGQVMPPHKFWLFQAGADDDDDPYGVGLGYYLYWPVWIKRNILRFWSLFVEEMARGRFSAKYPAGTKPDQVAQIKQMLVQLTKGGSVAISDNVAIDLFEALRNSGGDYKLFAQYLDDSISKITLSQTMTTDDGASLSQAQVHSGVKLEVIKGDADLKCESFNRGPAKWLTGWNFPGAATPIVYRNCKPIGDTYKQAQRDKILDSIGWEMKDDYVQEEYGDGFQRRKKPAPSTDTEGAETSESDDTPAFAEGDDSNDWRPLISPTVDALDALLNDCNSLEEARDRLGEVARTDPKEHVEMISRATFAGAVAGRVGAGLDGERENDA